ncbi:MAG: ectoine synthase [Pirellulaceae bacterium]
MRLVESGEVFDIQAGTVYALDRNDKHVLAANRRIRMVCVFNPPLVGDETHDESGAYPLLQAAQARSGERLVARRVLAIGYF